MGLPLLFSPRGRPKRENAVPRQTAAAASPAGSSASAGEMPYSICQLGPNTKISPAAAPKPSSRPSGAADSERKPLSQNRMFRSLSLSAPSFRRLSQRAARLRTERTITTIKIPRETTETITIRLRNRNRAEPMVSLG